MKTVKKSLSENFYQRVSLIFLLLGVVNFFVGFYEGSPENVLTFCSISLFFFAFGLSKRSNLVIGSVFSGLFLIELLWLIDTVSFFVGGNLVLGVAGYLVDSSKLRLVVTFYHFFLLVFPAYVVLREGKIHRFSWLGASLYFLIVSVVTLVLTERNINCVRDFCEIGVFNFLFFPTFLPPFIFNWIFATVVLFIPTHLFFSYVLRGKICFSV